VIREKKEKEQRRTARNEYGGSRKNCSAARVKMLERDKHFKSRRRGEEGTFAGKEIRGAKKKGKITGKGAEKKEPFT